MKLGVYTQSSFFLWNSPESLHLFSVLGDPSPEFLRCLPSHHLGFVPSTSPAKRPLCPPFTRHHTALLYLLCHFNGHLKLPLIICLSLSLFPPRVQTVPGLTLSLPVAPSAPRTVPDTQSMLHTWLGVEGWEKKGVKWQDSSKPFPRRHSPAWGSLLLINLFGNFKCL